MSDNHAVEATAGATPACPEADKAQPHEPSPAEVLAKARAYAAAGLVVIPVKLGGSKAPACGLGWRRRGVPADADLVRWFGGSRPKGLGIVCGTGSGHL